MSRFIDFFLSIVILMLFLPILMILSFLIRISDNGPVFFRQYRVGKNCLMFKLYKFRSMSIKNNAEDGSFEPGDNSRVTKLGAFIRKTKLDELPQLINVLKGDMSIVGPRPEVRKWVDVYPERWAWVLTVKPGITDPASIYYRNEEDLLSKAEDPETFYRDHILPDKLDLYEEYVRTRTFWGDVGLIMKTILSVLFPRRLSMH
ncbi:sugar transferase [Desulfatiferula olefinivorans]